MSIDRSVYIKAYRNLKSLYDTLNNDNVDQYSNMLYRVANDLKIVKTYLSSNYNSAIFNDYNKFEAMYYKILYFGELYASSDWIKMTIDEYNSKKGSIFDREKLSYKEVNSFIDALLSGNNPMKYKTEIARIISGKMAAKTLVEFFRNIKIRTDNFRMLNEAFYNPFDDELLDHDEIINEPKQITPEDTRLIKKIKIYNNRANLGGIKFLNDRVYATKTFYMDDIIEVAPVRVLDDSDLYSSNVRKMTFPIDLNKRIFGVPFGIGSIARNELETGLTGNIDYEYDPDKANEIIIYATKRINKGDELIFVNDNKMEVNKLLLKNNSHPDDILKINSINA